MGYSQWGHKESDTTEQLMHLNIHCSFLKLEESTQFGPQKYLNTDVRHGIVAENVFLACKVGFGLWSCHMLVL